ncbi:MAG: hypothetical protein ACP5IA_08425 [Sediminispirochaetaceae bacterium]
MKKCVLILILFSIVVLFVPAQEINTDYSDPGEIVFGLAEITPNWALGGFFQYMKFPWAIPIGGGRSNYLGFGGNVGAYYCFSESRLYISAKALFEGRFTGSSTFAVDAETGLGFIAADGGTGFIGTLGLAPRFNVNPNLLMRIFIGIDFAGNPAYDPLDYDSKEFIYYFRLNVGIVKEL